MRNKSEFVLFRRDPWGAARLLVCVLALSLVMPAGGALAQDAVARQLEMAKQQTAELAARVAQLQAELQKQLAVADQCKAQSEAAAAEAAQLRAQLLLAKSEQDRGLKSLVETTDALQAVRAENALLKAENKRLHDLAAQAGVLPKKDPFALPKRAAPPAASVQAWL